MNPQSLNYFPRLATVLSTAYRKELKESLDRTSGRYSNTILNIYTVYVDTTLQLNTPYSALDIRNNKEKLSNHFSMFVGFACSEFGVETAYQYCYRLRKTLNEIFIKTATLLGNIVLPRKSNSGDAQVCTFLYKSHHINSSLLKYYSGWSAQSKDGTEIPLHLAKVFDRFGPDYTCAVHQKVSDYVKTLKMKTAQMSIFRMVILLNTFTELCENRDELEHGLRAENSTNLMLNAFHVLISRNIQNNNCIESFINDWSNYFISTFTSCFIDTGFIDEPIIPFIAPKFKSPKSNKHTISIGGQLAPALKERVFAEIPIEIKDEKSLEIIATRLKLDLEHIRQAFQNVVNEIIARHDRNIEYIKNGKVREKNKSLPMGLNHHPGNTIATFYHHGYGGSSGYSAFLGEKNNRGELIKELNIPTVDTLMAFAALLVIEHPKITPAWLQEWELFDKNNTQVGYKQSGKQWIAVSFKHRRGATLAQQEVCLSNHSKRIVEALIAHTKFARDTLKKSSNDDWRYVMLSSNLTAPTRLKNINSSILSSKGFYRFLYFTSFDEASQIILTKKNAEKLAPLVSLRNIRKSRGLQIYIETHSVKAVADALGHKEANFKTLSSYLPEPLLDYFNSRWVRIFQNAIIFEALKDSTHLFSALDFDENTLEEFLHNHRLKDLPDQLRTAKDSFLFEEHQTQIEQLDELVYTLSVPLLQILIAIRSIAESAKKGTIISPIIQKWHESSSFILSHFSLENSKNTYRYISKEARLMHEKAIKNPIDLNVFRDNLSCP